jgi:hypothetical protein
MPIATPQGTLDFKSVDKVTFVGASSNTVIDTTTGSLGVGVGVGGPTSNLHVVGDALITGNVSDLNVVSNVNMLHTANTASIKLNSNVVTEFPRSKKLIKYPRVAMTANDNSGTSGYVADQTNTASHGNADAYAYRLFDNTSGAYQSGTAYSSGNPTASAPTTTASDGSTHQGVAITLDLVTKIRLDHVVITSHSNYGRTPVDGTFLGSHNSSTWDVIGTFTGLSTFANNQKHTITITNSSQKLAYRYIRFVVTKTHNSSVYNGGSLLEFRELQYFGVPEYDPDAHGTDVTVKSYPNVPNTDWLEVYYDAKDLEDDATLSAVSGLGGTTINGTTLGDPQVSNKAFVFDGSGDAIVSGATSLGGQWPPPPLSYSVWFKTNSIITGNNSIVMIGYADAYKSIGFRIENGTYRFYVYNGATNESVTTTIVAEIGIWTHATVVYDGLNSKLYIDGKFALQNTNTTTGLALLSGAKVALGNYIDWNGNVTTISANDSYDGSIANFRLFSNRALTSDEIYQLYAYQKEDFGHSTNNMTLKAGRLGIGTSEPRAALDVRGDIHAVGSVNPVIGMWKQSINSATVTTTILTNIGSCMSTKTPDGHGAAGGFSGEAGIFVAPYDGIYQFQAFLIAQSTGSNCLLVFNANGPSVDNNTWNSKNLINSYNELFELRGTVELEEPITFATLLNMSKGDRVDIQNHSTGYLGLNDLRCSAFLLHRFN